MTSTGTHPEREAITRRYLKHQRSLVDDALAQLQSLLGQWESVKPH